MFSEVDREDQIMRWAASVLKVFCRFAFTSWPTSALMSICTRLYFILSMRYAANNELKYTKKVLLVT